MSDARHAALAVLKLAYPRQPLEPGTLKLYGSMLGDIEPELLLRTVREVVGESIFFPTIAELRGRAAELVNDHPTLTEAIAGLADGSAWRAHPLIRAAAKATIGMHYDYRQSANQSTLRAQFREQYKALRRERILDTQRNAALPGHDRKQLTA